MSDNYFYIDDSNFKINQEKDIVVHWTRKPTKEETLRNIYKKNEIITIYYNYTKGMYLDKMPEDVKLIKVTNKSTFGLDYEFIENKNLLRITICEFIANKPSFNGETKGWNIHKSIFIDKNKKYYRKLIPEENPFDVLFEDILFVNEKGESLYKECPIWSMPFNITSYPTINSNEIGINVIDKRLYEILSILFYKYVRIGKFNIYPLKNLYILDLFLRNKEPLQTSGAKQKELDKLLLIPLKPAKLPKSKSKKNKTEKISLIQKVDKNICCIRVYLKIICNEIDFNEDIEIYRIYIKKNKVICCKPNNENEFVLIKGSLTNEDFNFKLINIKNEDLSDTPLYYLSKILPKFEESKHSFILLTFMKWTILEKLYNAGFEDFIAECIANYENYDCINKEIERIFGKINNSKTLYGSLGINKYQLSKLKEYEDFSYYYSDGYDYKKRKNIGLLAIIKHITSKNKLSDLDNKTFDEIITISIVAQKILKTSNDAFERNVINRILYLCNILSHRYNINTTINMFKILHNFFQNKNLSTFADLYILRQYEDYLNLIYRINELNEFKPTFKTVDELNTLHNDAVIVYNTITEKLQKDAFDKIRNKWKKWEYKNKDYAIIAPKEPTDLVKEGITLRHCVKSYIQKVAEGATNILFVRKINNIEEPFFTIEISNKGVVEQIHGFSNRNLSTSPDLIPFIEKWAKEKDIILSDYNKVR